MNPEVQTVKIDVDLSRPANAARAIVEQTVISACDMLRERTTPQAVADFQIAALVSILLDAIDHEGFGAAIAMIHACGTTLLSERAALDPQAPSGKAH